MLKKGDMYLIAAILLAAAAVFGFMKLYNAGAGHKQAVILQDGKIIKRIDLDTVHDHEDIILEGEYTNKILVEKGRIRYEDANCPNRDCVKTGWVSDKGSVAVCLPNKTMIRIEGANQEIDGGTY